MSDQQKIDQFLLELRGRLDVIEANLDELLHWGRAQTNVQRVRLIAGKFRGIESVADDFAGNLDDLAHSLRLENDASKHDGEVQP